MPAGKSEEKALVRRYLIWCYKSTKESLDRIDRKFTQVTVDRFILDRLRKAKGPVQTPAKNEYQKMIDDFVVYLTDKEKDGIKQKFTNKDEVAPQYLYLKNRLSAIEEAIEHFLGPRELTVINRMFEEEFTRRILESKEH